MCIFSHLPAECTLWQGCCRHPGLLLCRQPPGSGIVSRWSDLSADSSSSLGCWCSSPGSPLAALPDGIYTQTCTKILVNTVCRFVRSLACLSGCWVDWTLLVSVNGSISGSYPYLGVLEHLNKPITAHGKVYALEKCRLLLTKACNELMSPQPGHTLHMT